MSNIKLSDQEYLLAELAIKVTAIERLLVKAGIVTATEIDVEMKKISQEVINFMASGQFGKTKIDNTDKN